MLKTTQSTLPTPDSRPGADVVLFDGNCVFCRRQVARLERLDRLGALAYMSLHNPQVANRYPDLTRDDMMSQMYVVDSRGRRHGGAEAIRYLSRRLVTLWPLAPLMHIPFSLPLWQRIYRFIAARRYAIGGDIACENGICRLPEEKTPD